MKSRRSGIVFMVPPRKVHTARGRWKFPAEISISASEADALALEKTVELLGRRDIPVRIADEGENANIRIVRSSKISGVEGYKLTVSTNGATIEASTDAGAFYGSATLREILRCSSKSCPCMVIHDEPAFARRAVYHDTARGKVPKLETMKGLIDRLAEWKINEFQLYVENAFEFKSHPDIAKGFSPFKVSELKALGEYCRQRFIKFVPSLASFGHMEKALQHPKYAHLNELANGSTLCPNDPGSIKFVSDLYDDFLPLFDKGDFNVCCDETWDLGKGRSTALCQKRGTGRVYLDFLKKIHKLCRRHGMRMNAWADIILQHPELLDDAPKDIVMLNWDYAAEGVRIPRTNEIADAGFPFMVCPGTSSWSTMGTRWINARENIRNFAAVGAEYGAEGVLNTDWGDGNHRQPLAVSMMGFAFGAAESWNPGTVDKEKFHNTFAFHAYGGDKALGEAIYALGRIDDLGDTDRRSRYSWLYYNLDETLTAPSNAIWYNLPRGIDKRPPEQIDRVLANLPDESVWNINAADTFDKLCMSEYAMVGRLTTLYCLRSSVAWQMGMGQKVSAKAFKNLADCTDAVASDYSSLWKIRNKPSRLGDFMKLFKNASNEARKLANGR